jgi:hypothetical protein
MPAFVIQRHEKQDEPVHWDLMLEHGDCLKTFRLDRLPESPMGACVTATPIFDHEKRFLTYEGPVNQGRGQVTIADQGVYETVDQSPTRWRLQLRGDVLSGTYILEKTEGKLWEFRHIKTEDRRIGR